MPTERNRPPTTRSPPHKVLPESRVSEPRQTSQKAATQTTLVAPAWAASAPKPISPAPLSPQPVASSEPSEGNVGAGITSREQHRVQNETPVHTEMEYVTAEGEGRSQEPLLASKTPLHLHQAGSTCTRLGPTAPLPTIAPGGPPQACTSGPSAPSRHQHLHPLRTRWVPRARTKRSQQNLIPSPGT